MEQHPQNAFGKQTFVGRVQGVITDKYQMIKEIGAGSYGRVYKVKNKTTGEFLACKQLAKGKITNLEQFNFEIDVLIQMDHPHIIKLYEVYEDTRYVYLVMEECTGGELFERITNRTQSKNLFTEKEAASIFKQMMSAICYCHAQKICHRDMKPENLLYVSKDDDSPLKVIDFGLSRICDKKSGEKLTSKVGTAYYVSPEVLDGEYDQMCDIWSCGVILYLLLSGEPPFNGNNDAEIYKKIAAKKFSFPDEQWKNISDDAKDLITHMLAEPDQRYTAEQVLQHTWVENLAPNAQDVILNLNLSSLQKYKNNNKLKKAALTFIASRLKDLEVANLKTIFEILDKNKDGTLTLEEVKEGIEKLKECGADIDIEEVFKSMDTDNSGVINYTEFIAASMDEKVYLKEERLYEAFKTFDSDGNGKISIDEIKKVLNSSELENEKLTEMVNKFDVNGDGEIDYNEFLTMMGSSL